LREKLIKIGAKVVGHGGYVIFQRAEVAVPRQMFQEILSLIAQRCASMQAKLRVLAPRRSQLIGSTSLRTRCAIYVARDGRRGDPWPHNHVESGNVGLRPSYRPVSLPAPRAAKL
jgi:hypothetical protein